MWHAIRMRRCPIRIFGGFTSQGRSIMRTTFASAVLAVLAVLSVASDRAQGSAIITFNPATPTTFTDETGFVGSSTIPSGGYTRVRVLFDVAGLLTPNFDLSSIFVKGDGITGSLSLGQVTTDGNDFVVAGPGTIPALLSVDFTNSSLSFGIPAGMNIGTSIAASIQYSNANSTQVITSDPIVFVAVPEPSALELALGAAGLFSVACVRRRRACC